MTNAIVVAGEWQSMKDQAAVLVKSGMLPKAVDTPEKAIVIMLQGRELGIGYMQALNGINVIQGKPTVSPQLMLALIQRSGELEDMTIVDDGEACTVTMKRRGQSAHSETFSTADANAMGLSGKDNWRKQPVVMRKWRAVSACSRVVFSDITMGLYTSEEISPEVNIDTETGEIVDSDAITHPEPENATSGHPGAPQGAKTNIAHQQDTSTYDLNKPVCKLTGQEIHDLKRDLLEELRKSEPKMVERHMENRIKDRFDVKSIVEVQDTVIDFWAVMMLTHAQWKLEIGDEPQFGQMPIDGSEASEDFMSAIKGA